MTRPTYPRALTAAFLLVSAALSGLVLAQRNLYDDEVMSLDLVLSPVRKILLVSAEGDVHPPGMYLLGRFAYTLIPSFRWMNLIPALAFYLGLAIFLFQIAPLFTRTRPQLCLLLFATLHPQIFLWSATYRWYSWWTGLALLTLTVALQPRAPHPEIHTIRAGVLALLLAGLFYLNYITVLFGIALLPAIYLRYRNQSLQPRLRRYFLIVMVFLALITPQLHTLFIVHFDAARAQRYPFVLSCLRLFGALAASEAYLPWHPIAVLAGVLIALLALVGLVSLFRRNLESAAANPSSHPQGSAAAAGPHAVAMPLLGGIPPSRGDPVPDFGQDQESGPASPTSLDGPITAVVYFALAFAILVAATGLGGKPRNALLLVPTLAPALALGVEVLRPPLRYAAVALLALWIGVGLAHLTGRYGLLKSTMNDRPEQVVAFLRQSAARAPSQPSCAVVVTYDAILAFTVAQANLPRTQIVSPYRGPVFAGDATLPNSPGDCPRPSLFLVASYFGGTAAQAHVYDSELASAARSITPPRLQHAFSPDPDAPRKRLLPFPPQARRLPDYRYVVTSGAIDRATLPQILTQLPDYRSEQIQPQP